MPLGHVHINEKDAQVAGTENGEEEWVQVRVSGRRGDGQLQHMDHHHAQQRELHT